MKIYKTTKASKYLGVSINAPKTLAIKKGVSMIRTYTPSYTGDLYIIANLRSGNRVMRRYTVIYN